MLPLLLGLALAQDADLETRLLGPEPAPIETTVTDDVPPPAATPAAPALEMPPWWTLPLLGLALGWAYTQRRKTEKVEADAMRVLGRTPLGKDTSVVLLEVRDAHGAWRRLLVGSGSEGPQLITGLGSTHQVVAVQPAVPPSASFASMMDRAETGLDTLPEVPAYPVAPPAPEPPPSMVTSWNRAEEPEPTSRAERPVLGPAGELAAAIHGRIPRGYPTTPPQVSTEPPPVQPPTEPSRNAQEGLDLLAEVRRAKSRIGTRVQTYG